MGTIPAFYESDAAVSPWHIEAAGVAEHWKQSRGAGIVVAVIDTGIDPRHPDFSGRIVEMRTFEGGSVNDENGHGTHVAGIVAGARTGLAPEARLVSLKVGDSKGRVDTEAAKEALRYVREFNGQRDPADRIRYVNCSFGSPAIDLELWVVIKELVKSGVSIFVSAGNSGDGSADTWEPNFPGFFPEVICLGACQQDFQPAKFSSSYDGVDFMAFGVDVYSCWPGGGYKALSGTSMASPMALGMCLLLEAAFGRPMTDDERYAALMRYARPTSGNPLMVGHGVLDYRQSPRFATEITMTVGSSEFLVNGQQQQMEGVPQIIADRLYVPVRYVAEAFGATVRWDGEKGQARFYR
ncbi:S8 family serine peptidase [Heliobacterium gestii]|uniref:S8 family serine peptidase n=1 Tax=Heliomicrobium gestii TaxID=2699 RepID=A0A845LC37_HELGE|nr:S8 family serine peptidase [Heliomicrobium gestii]MBM7866780.1 major intracellular serine protease [Heliomicrobium gestii]MZP42209.1 S8 family serine peptidase [Heliomicrobium gestii]